ncbi:MAG TPA: phosphate signaling complex protein PhoU [Pseudomonadales bacterium]|nr:phosphate signaling complex protein PhoU [Pseudomonadales bacterium]
MDNLNFDQHISRQFNSDLEALKAHLLQMGGVVEQQLADCVESLEHADSNLAQNVLKAEVQSNNFEISIDEECTRILARRQPAASDLRMVLAVAKIVRDLERIGDESAKIAKMAIVLSEQGNSPRGIETRHIGSHVCQMVRDALTAFARYDAELALEVAREDKEVDREYSSAMREMITFMMEDPRTISRVLNILWALRSLERIGDHARNIAEQVIYLVKGKDARHMSLPDMEKLVQE